MPHFGTSSMGKLVTCHRDLQTVMHELIKFYDVSVVFGHRIPEEQFELYKKGRKESGDKWVIKDHNDVVTFKDGYEKKSKHNANPSKAIDIIPYPSGWADKPAFHYMAGIVMYIADIMLKDGRIEKPLSWGGHWTNFIDLPHFQI